MELSANKVNELDQFINNKLKHLNDYDYAVSVGEVRDVLQDIQDKLRGK